MERPRPTFVGFVLLLGTLTATAAWAAEESVNVALAYASFLVAYLAIHLFVHEIGHLVAAVVLRMPLLGFRVGPVRLGLEQHMAGAGGHVLVDLSRLRSAVRPRIIAMILAGPAFELVLAWLVAPTVGDAAHSPWFRAAALGLTVALVHGALENLSPVPPLTGFVSDGHTALSWIVAPGRERAAVQLEIDLARLHAGYPQLAPHIDRRHIVRALVDDPRPEMASAAMKELFRTRPRGDDGWNDAEAVTSFVARRDVPGEERAAIAGNYALSLALSHAAARRSLDTIPASNAPVPDRIVELAEAAREAHSESLQAGAALGLARIMQGRPHDARACLGDVESPNPDDVRARAMAVRSIAEGQLGDDAAANRLLDAAQDVLAQDPVVRLAGRVLAPVD